MSDAIDELLAEAFRLREVLWHRAPRLDGAEEQRAAEVMDQLSTALRSQRDLLQELMLPDRNVRDATEFQRHRDHWRGYAYGRRDRPPDFLSFPVNTDPTEIDRLRADLTAARSELERARADSARVDWFVAQGYPYAWKDGKKKETVFHMIDSRETLDDAIAYDAARAAEPAK